MTRARTTSAALALTIGLTVSCLAGTAPASAPASGLASAGTPGGVAAVTYAVPATAPSSGFTTVSFPLTVLKNASPTASWYWADEVEFVGDSSIAYMGLQPNGEYQRTALFSVFGSDTSGRAPSCATGADGGSGTSCHLHYDWHANRTYVFTMALTSKSASSETWRGSVTDTVSGAITQVGKFKVGAARGLIEPLLGFSEYFSSVSACSAVPQMDVRYGAPTVSAAGRSYAGTVSSAYTYGSTSGSYIDCRAIAHPSHNKVQALIQAPLAGYSAPHAPSGLRVRRRTGSVRFSWHTPQAPHGIARYVVVRNGKVIAQTTLTHVIDTHATARRTYRYDVFAVDRLGQSGPFGISVNLPQ